ncbi:hypothetical protein TNCT_111131 [Trichonephila clavata]|uniref:Uncharacterized protein n=1 Tax=Trichonephila clavata TaxID=2740835 RepID=A0A8X6JBY0_TRICU|nr:hypothetical protein TNCT_111131 [Trichonephila clavata]
MRLDKWASANYSNLEEIFSATDSKISKSNIRYSNDNLFHVDLNDYSIQKRQHTGEKPFECEVGKRIVQDNSNLSRHKRSYVGENRLSSKMSSDI